MSAGCKTSDLFIDALPVPLLRQVPKTLKRLETSLKILKIRVPCFGTLFLKGLRSAFGSILAPFWSSFGSLLVPFGTLLLTLGSLCAPLGTFSDLWDPSWSLVVPIGTLWECFWCTLCSFGSLWEVTLTIFCNFCNSVWEFVGIIFMLQNCPLVFECRTYTGPSRKNVAKVAPQARPQATGHE